MSEVRTQQELDAAIGRGDAWIDIVGSGVYTVRAYGSSTVTAYGSSTVTAYGSSTVTACDSSTVRAYDSSTVTAYGSSTVTAYDSSTVTAYGSSTVRAYGSSTVTASPKVAVHDFGSGTKVKGGVIIPIGSLDTVEEFCEYYGIAIKRGVAVLYKAVEADWRGGRKHDGITYEPGAKPTAPDWDPYAGCGAGLHLVPRPFMGDAYLSGPPAHYVACPVRASEVVVIDRHKVKVPRVFRACYEVDVDGEPVEARS